MKTHPRGRVPVTAFVGLSFGVTGALVALCLCAGPAFAADAAVPEIKAGAAKASLVPPFPTPMGGFSARTEKFTGVESAPNARALVLDNGTTKVAIITCELIGVSRANVDKAREQIEKATGIPAKNIMISATHNHSAPSGSMATDNFPKADVEKLNEFFVNTWVKVATDAAQAMAPANLFYGMGHLDYMTHNRQQNNDTVIDPDMGVLKVQKKGSYDVIAVLYNFAAHPVILSSDNLKLSSEYPGHASETVEAVLGGVALFTQGACGDQTIKRNGPPFDEVKRIGHVVGAEAIRAAESAILSNDMTLISDFRDVTLEPRKIPTAADANAAVEKAQKALDEAKAANKSPEVISRLSRALDGAKTTVKIAERAAQRPPEMARRATQGCVQVMQIGPLVIVGMPTELFVEYALELKARIRQETGRPVIFVGYANNLNGYVITPRAFFTGGYEQSVTQLDPSAGRTFVETAMAMVNDCIKPVNKK